MKTMQGVLLLVLILGICVPGSKAQAEASESQGQEAPASRSQSAEKVYSFKKGEAVDFLFLMQRPESQDRLQDYFSKVFPIVKKAGYHPLPGFKIQELPTQGNYHPPALVIASWSSAKARADAMAEITDAVPDLQRKRMEIWSSFAMTVYEMDRDLSFTVDSGKVYVLTVQWAEEPAAFDRFKKRWQRFVEKLGGKVVLSLEDGASPSGYHYDPDLLTITEWPDRESFDAFYRRDIAVTQTSVKQVHQFILD